ncbi:extracellular solute-binding protein [Chamaesiphon sp. VAR_69_metabat_338]|uniref:extracellular solute-binding protein n=1 Tax=Chamaesiphon sp. VAR_69_metabat_338 TaxID=2964704 RepID=UPI00286E9A03|nr:extracellular solute-binding protein [Chamaesiphon sp. VAR_69_metabat_338]
MQRRSFLFTIGSLALGTGLTSCQGQDRSMLRLLALKNSLPQQLLSGFSRSFESNKPKVELAFEGQFTEILTQLQEWYQTGKADGKGLKIPFLPPPKDAAYIPNLVSVSDAWLATAIAKKSIQPIETQELTNWGKLETRWHELVRRDALGNRSEKGQIWGVPFRWGTTVILYRRDKLAEHNIPIPQDWQDLWHPQLRQRISLLDRSREVIGLTLKKLGESYNAEDLAKITNLKSELQKLHQQAKFYGAENYLQPLVMGDTWVAVGWSLDAIDLIQKNPNIGAIVPTSGTAISADLWVRPALSTKLSSAERLAASNADRLKLDRQWLDYCLQPQFSNQISLYTAGAAPLLTSLKTSEISPDIQKNPLTLPPKSVLDKSEFIYPLIPSSKQQFDRLWQEIRQTKVVLT